MQRCNVSYTMLATSKCIHAIVRYSLNDLCVFCDTLLLNLTGLSDGGSGAHVGKPDGKHVGGKHVMLR